MRRHLFAYGTLQHPAILYRILNRMPEATPARLNDFARYRISGENFPGIHPCPGTQIDGTVYFDLEEQEWQQLDHYESDLYLRQTLQVICEDGTLLAAEAYVIPPQHEHQLTREPWALADFEPDA